MSGRQPHPRGGGRGGGGRGGGGGGGWRGGRGGQGVPGRGSGCGGQGSSYEPFHVKFQACLASEETLHTERDAEVLVNMMARHRTPEELASLLVDTR
jgi:hypothetical protein